MANEVNGNGMVQKFVVGIALLLAGGSMAWVIKNEGRTSRIETRLTAVEYNTTSLKQITIDVAVIKNTMARLRLDVEDIKTSLDRRTSKIDRKSPMARR